MRTLTFEQITDGRLDTNTNLEELAIERVNTILALLKKPEGVHVFCDAIRKLTWNEEPEHEQYRCRFWVRKDSNKTTWDDVYSAINSVKAAPYKFVEFDWSRLGSNMSKTQLR